MEEDAEEAEDDWTKVLGKKEKKAKAVAARAAPQLSPPHKASAQTQPTATASLYTPNPHTGPPSKSPPVPPPTRPAPLPLTSLDPSNPQRRQHSIAPPSQPKFP